MPAQNCGLVVPRGNERHEVLVGLEKLCSGFHQCVEVVVHLVFWAKC